MERRTLMATYSSLPKARYVVQDLVRNNFKKDEIVVAIDHTTGEALLSLTTFADYLDYALHIVQHQKPGWVDATGQSPTIEYLDPERFQKVSTLE